MEKEMKSKFVRKLIEVEIRLGFLSIPSHGIELFSGSNEKIDVKINGEKRKLSFNANHRRIFGLTGWYKEIGAKIGDLIEVHKKTDVYEIKFLKEENVRKKTQDKEDSPKEPKSPESKYSY